MSLSKEVERVTCSLWGVMEFTMYFYLKLLLLSIHFMSYVYYSSIYLVFHFLIHIFIAQCPAHEKVLIFSERMHA